MKKVTKTTSIFQLREIQEELRQKILLTDEKLTINHKNAFLELPELSYSNLYTDNSDDGSGNVNLSVNTYICQFGELLNTSCNNAY